ncbi:rhomboid family intramembrane serine protease [Lapillicoccus sp.]|uniref:rhomboid family intramembrane serine protease n=1 Tax=Lapillicoccus sp. TaxID=1909287 RepID=UPI0025F15E51|nr:rhomboid family intramembrane serine protease [Lapillicoccus sp.]
MTEPPTTQQVPTCPRHPDRESYVRCQRCNRPTCPDCQRPAAVGIQCVDCVKEQSRGDRSTVTTFGGRASNPGVATKVLIGICVVVFVGQLVRPSLTTDLEFAPVVGWSEPWRVLTAAFLHSPGNFLHIAFNMLCLWQIGPYLEQLLGRARFVALYLISAIGGSAGVVLLAAAPPAFLTNAQVDAYQSWFTGVVGASGAVFGLFGALLVLNRHLGRSTAGIGVTIVLNGVLGFVIPGIAWQAHLGGFLTGVACAGAVALLNTPQRRRYVWPALAGVLVVVVGLMVVKYAGVPVDLR